MLSTRLIAVLLALTASISSAQPATPGARWFQIEVSIFSNEYPEYRDSEVWSPDRLRLEYPERIQRFNRLADFFRVRAFEQSLTVQPSGTPEELPEADFRAQADLAYLNSVGPYPLISSADLSLPDLVRSPYYLLPDSLSDFQTTNTRIERSPENRLLFHGLWRQPVSQPGIARALLIEGGDRFGPHHELEGSITIRFNTGEDRVVIDANLWLTEFTRSMVSDTDWELPSLPPSVQFSEAPAATEAYGITRIVQMRQSRDMRSNEFHYLDHPALGLVITVMPYDIPPRISVPALEEPTPLQ